MNFLDPYGVEFSDFGSTIIRCPKNFKGGYVIPNGVDKIASDAFMDCAGLTSIEIPASVNDIECYRFDMIAEHSCYLSLVNDETPRPFTRCQDLKTIVVDINNEVYDSRDTCNAIIESQTDTLIIGCNNTTIPATVTNIGYCAFMGCTGLNSIVIPSGVKEISQRAFYACMGLKSITIPDSVVDIELEAFERTAWYNDLPDGVVYAGNVAYKYKGEMAAGTSIKLKEGTVSISGYAFNNCTGLKSIEIPSSVRKIGYGAFNGCTNLSSIKLPSSLVQIHADIFNDTAWYKNQPNGGVFINRILLKYKGEMPKCTVIKIKGTISIARDAFNHCDSLKSIELPSSMEKIGDFAFYWCDNLKSIICKAKNPPMFERNSFLRLDHSIPVYVPQESIEKYKQIKWGDFNNFKSIEQESE